MKRHDNAAAAVFVKIKCQVCIIASAVWMDYLVQFESIEHFKTAAEEPGRTTLILRMTELVGKPVYAVRAFETVTRTVAEGILAGGSSCFIF